MTTPSPLYTTPTVTIPLQPLESWTEIRCPACVPLGWDSSRLLFKVFGVMQPTSVQVQVRCHRCRSLISWTFGLPRIIIVEHGPKNHKKRKVAFE